MATITKVEVWTTRRKEDELGLASITIDNVVRLNGFVIIELWGMPAVRFPHDRLLTPVNDNGEVVEPTQDFRKTIVNAILDKYKEVKKS